MSEVEVYSVNKLKFCARDKNFVGKKNRARDIPRFLIVELKCLCVITTSKQCLAVYWKRTSLGGGGCTT